MRAREKNLKRLYILDYQTIYKKIYEDMKKQMDNNTLRALVNEPVERMK